MRILDIDDVHQQFHSLIEQAARGQSFVIAKAGKSLVQVLPLAAPGVRFLKRTGFLAGQISVPEDFDQMGGGVEGMLGWSR
jgi:antitoxin (DNA-binding transcriptional repressor) of toxin-antitoxin stability system